MIMTTTRKQTKRNEQAERIKREQFWRMKRTPSFDRKGHGIEIQTVGWTGNELAHAGVHWVPELSARYLWKLHRSWTRWAHWTTKHPMFKGNHGKTVPTVTAFCAHPIDEPKQQTWINPQPLQVTQ